MEDYVIKLITLCIMYLFSPVLITDLVNLQSHKYLNVPDIPDMQVRMKGGFQ